MNQLTTEGIILQRTDYGEADRILVLLTPDQGKLHVLAKGVRRVTSKLAGGIELFSVSHLTYIKGRSDLGTLVATRLIKHYGTIVKDISRTMLGYDLIKRLNKATEDQPESGYFELLQQSFEALDDLTIDLALLDIWFSMQLLRMAGHTPNLQTDITGQKLAADVRYNFSFDDMTFASGNLPSGGNDYGLESGGSGAAGRFTANHIKFLRLGFSGYPPRVLQQVQGSTELVRQVMPLVRTMLQAYIRQ